jgi:hypothetical protein
MLHVFSINRVKLVVRTPTAIDIKGQMEYLSKKVTFFFIE